MNIIELKNGLGSLTGQDHECLLTNKVVFKFLCHFFKLYQKEMIYDYTYF